MKRVHPARIALRVLGTLVVVRDLSQWHELSEPRREFYRLFGVMTGGIVAMIVVLSIFLGIVGLVSGWTQRRGQEL